MAYVFENDKTMHYSEARISFIDAAYTLHIVSHFWNWIASWHSGSYAHDICLILCLLMNFSIWFDTCTMSIRKFILHIDPELQYLLKVKEDLS